MFSASGPAACLLVEAFVRGVHQGSHYTGLSTGHFIYDMCHQGQYLPRQLASYYLLEHYTSPNIHSDEHAAQPAITHVETTP